MCTISHEIFQDIIYHIAQAELDEKSGEIEKSVTHITEAHTIIVKHGAAGHIGIEIIPCDSGNLFRLCGSDGHGVSYTIKSDGVTFPSLHEAAD